MFKISIPVPPLLTTYRRRRLRFPECAFKFPVCLFIPWISWWRHQMEAFTALLPFCAGNSQVTCYFRTQRPVTWSIDAFFDLHLNLQLSKRWRRWWLETSLRSVWRHGSDRVNFATENMQHFSPTRHAFVALLIQLALFRVDCGVDVSISIRLNFCFSKGKRRKMSIIRCGGYM